MFLSNCPRWVLALGLGLAAASSGHATELFRDDFDVPGTKLDLAKWTTEFGAPSFLGRTQLRDWVSPSGVGKFTVADGQAHLDLNTYNPTGFSLYGTHGKTVASFAPIAGTDITLSVRMRLDTLQPGLVFGMYFYGCPTPASCSSVHDELDIELFTNFLQPSATPLRVQLNRYAAEPLGAGHGPVVSLPAAFDTLAAHEWTIRWGKSRVSYSLDGTELYSATDFVPQGAMQANIIAWGPSANDLAAAYSASLQPTASAAADRTYGALVDWVSVQAVPEPSTWLSMLAGLGALGFVARHRKIAAN